jgi:hypothetical protein
MVKLAGLASQSASQQPGMRKNDNRKSRAVNRRWLLLAAATARRLPLKPRAAEQEEEKRKVEEKDQNGWA